MTHIRTNLAIAALVALVALAGSSFAAEEKLYYEDRGDIPEQYRPLLENTRLVYYDARYYRDRYHMVVFPTVVGVDAAGFVQHIQFGFDGTVDPEIVEYFTLNNR